ncbi:hypothetical protein PK35_02300 [Tamlana nanhaiensis]|uniref:Fibronectin type-III domain-containing protein n=1 Tax=Neotamlana nanhaiensis TaxID=1382798 RepID=A0A0D7W6G4_9FLAO|nr:fibronectin type III domain-containing protein [Tamlana nanhaiensis]KJD34629.1 hypothetical protein PK35_02300 [Tamlana nanhaiensis]
MKNYLIILLLFSASVVSSQNYFYAIDKAKEKADTEAPTMPFNLSATNITETSADLRWTNATDNIAVVGYNIYNNLSLIQVVDNQTTFTLTGLTEGTTYNIIVRAFDAAGNESEDSNIESFITLDSTTPSTPTNLTVSNITETTADLNWTAATDNIAVTGYKLYLNGVLRETLNNITSYTLTNLTAASNYSVYITAIDAFNNESTASNTVTFSTVDTTPPTSPINLVANTISETTATLSWTASSDNVGVTGYNVYNNNTLVATLGTVLTYNLTNLTTNATYNFTVTAFDAAGNESGNSNSVSFTTIDSTPPAAPINLVASNITETSADLNWTASTDNVAVVGYNLYVNNAFIETLSNTNSYILNDLTTATTYSVNITAIDASGNESNSSNTETFTTTDITPPTSPINLTVSNITETTSYLNWDNATDNVAVTGYNIYNNTTLLATTGTTSNYNLTGLSPDTNYNISVTAFDAAGNESATSNTSAFKTQAVVTTDTESPTTPLDLVVTNITETTAELTWTASSDNIAVAGYSIYQGNSLIQSVSNVTNYTLINLTENTNYQISLVAFDNSGNRSQNSNEVSFTTLFTEVNFTLEHINAGNNSVVANISNGYSANEDVFRDFNVNAIPSRTAASVSFNLTGPVTTNRSENSAPFSLFGDNGTEFNAGNHLPEGSYTLTVRAWSSTFGSGTIIGETTVSFTVLAPTPDTESPTEPTDLIVDNITETTADLTWTASSDNIAIAGYYIYNGVTLIATTEAVTSYTLTNLNPSTEYNVFVRAFDDAANESGDSNVVNFTTDTPPDNEAPTAPLNLVASNITFNSATLTWNSSTDNIAVTDYRIYSSDTLLINSTANDTIYYLNNLLPETDYSLTVRAIDAANNESSDSNIVTFTTLDEGPNLTNEDEYFDCYLLPIERKNELQEALDTYGCVRLEAGDYGWGSNANAITLTSNQKLFGHPSISKVPNITIAAGSTGVEISSVSCGYSGTNGITFEAGTPITNCKLSIIDFTPVRATGAQIENCEFIGFRNSQIIWDMSASGYFRNNKFIKHTLQNNTAYQYAQHYMLGNDVNPSFGNTICWVNYLTASSTGAYIDNVDDMTFVGIDMESWNWDNNDIDLANLHILNAGNIRIHGFQGAAINQTYNLPAFHIESENTMISSSVASINPNNIIEGNSIATGGKDFAKTLGEDLRLLHDNQLAQLNNVDVTTPITNQATIDSLHKVLLMPQRTPWAKPTLTTLPDPLGTNWANERNGKPDSHAYIQNLVDTQGIANLPEGIYYISEPIVMPMNYGLVGEGTGKTVIVGLTDDFPLIKMSHDVMELGSKTGACTFSNMTLQGGKYGIQLTSNVDSNAAEFPGSAYYSDCSIRNIIFRDNEEGINLYNTYGLDNNHFENLYFVNNAIGFHQEPLSETDPTLTTWSSTASNFVDKTFFYNCQFINVTKAIYLNADIRPNNLNAFVNCLFDGSEVVCHVNKQNTGQMVNSIIRNTSGTEPLTKGSTSLSYIACLFENNSVPYYFGSNAGLYDSDLLDEIPLFSGAGANQLYATNSTILGTVPNKDGLAMIINTSMPNEPTFNKMIVVKGYLTDTITVLDEAPNPYPQLLVTH